MHRNRHSKPWASGENISHIAMDYPRFSATARSILLSHHRDRDIRVQPSVNRGRTRGTILYKLGRLDRVIQKRRALDSLFGPCLHQSCRHQCRGGGGSSRHTCLSVLGEVQLGELLCDSLVDAEDAPLLRFAISENEVSRDTYTHLIHAINCRRTRFFSARHHPCDLYATNIHAPPLFTQRGGVGHE